MVKELMHDPIFLAGESEVAEKEKTAKSIPITSNSSNEGPGDKVNFS